MRFIRSGAHGAALLALALLASACGSGVGGDGGGGGSGGGNAGGGEPVASQMTLGGPPECPERPFCIPGLEEVYGIEFGDFRALDVGGPLTVKALEAGRIDVALLFSTNSQIADRGWVALEDDKNLQLAENITPVVREDVLNPTITKRLNEVSATLTTENMTELNGRVEIDGDDPEDVAEAWLEEQGLDREDPEGASRGQLTVGAVAFAENQIVAEMYSQVLGDAGYDIDERLNLGSREIVQPAIESGEIDVAPEYIGSLLFYEDPEAEGGDAGAVRQELEPLLKDKGIALLESSEANNTNAFVVTQETADEFGLAKVSDLAKPASS